MGGILLTALAIVIASLLLGQTLLRLCGATAWSWLSAPVGISLLMLVSVPSLHLPGRTTTVAVLLAALTLAAAVWCLRDAAHRPPATSLLALGPAAFLALVPFIVNGRGGIMGVSFNNDMAAHLLWAESYLSAAVERITPLAPDYPLGPHALVAVFADGLGQRIDQAFSGLALALPVLNACTALMLLRRGASWPARVLTATVVGMPFLVAAYYGQAAFKEVLQAQLVLAVALVLAGRGPQLSQRFRWVPVAVVIAGMVSVYSVTGLPWPIAFLGLWLLGHTVVLLRRGGGVGALVQAVRAQLPSVAIGAVALLVVLVPQLPRLKRYFDARSDVNGTGIAASELGNLVGRLPGWEALGVWSNPDFRFPASFTAGMLAAVVLALVLVGTAALLSRGRWMLPVATAASLLIWFVSNDSQSPYVSAKALVIASPLLLAIAVLAIVERGPRWQSWRVVPLIGVLLFAAVGVSDLRALRAAQIGPLDHVEELRQLQSDTVGRPTLFLGHDDFIRWELAETPVRPAVINMGPELPLRAEKPWAFPNALDFDSVDAATLNRFDWVITTRDAAGSAPPPQLRLVRSTRSYDLWRREGDVQPRTVLAEGGGAGAVLECKTPAGRRLSRERGVAAVRAAPLVVEGPAIAPGGSAAVALPLPRGSWELSAVYTSPRPIAVSMPGLKTTLPANLDRVGPRWPIGRVDVAGGAPLPVSLSTTRPLLAPDSAVAVVSRIVATRDGTERVVPLRDACGKYVDWLQVR